jgi:hypothetical protein
MNEVQVAEQRYKYVVHSVQLLEKIHQGIGLHPQQDLGGPCQIAGIGGLIMVAMP